MHGAWLLECFIHVALNDNGTYVNITAGQTGGKQTMRDTIGAWYAQQKGGSSSLSTKVYDGPWGSDPSCKDYTPQTVAAPELMRDLQLCV